MWKQCCQSSRRVAITVAMIALIVTIVAISAIMWDYYEKTTNKVRLWRGFSDIRALLSGWSHAGGSSSVDKTIIAMIITPNRWMAECQGGYSFVGRPKFGKMTSLDKMSRRLSVDGLKFATRSRFPPLAHPQTVTRGEIKLIRFLSIISPSCPGRRAERIKNCIIGRFFQP